MSFVARGESFTSYGKGEEFGLSGHAGCQDTDCMYVLVWMYIHTLITYRGGGNGWMRILSHDYTIKPTTNRIWPATLGATIIEITCTHTSSSRDASMRVTRWHCLSGYWGLFFLLGLNLPTIETFVPAWFQPCQSETIANNIPNDSQ